jgi:acetyl esterase/lipase
MKKHLPICVFMLALGLGLVFACKKKTDEPEDKPAVAENFLNVSYGSDAKQKFNIYLPANRTSSTTPVLFLIHGGAWRAGDRSDFNNSIDPLKSMFPNYAFVSISYRLYAGGVNKFPTQEADVKSCIEQVLNNHQQYKVSTSFGVLGASAGAHLSMLYAYKYGITSYRPKAVVSWSGPTEFKSFYNGVSSTLVKSWISDVAGNLSTPDSLVYNSSSPARFVTSTSPPTLLIQGQADTVVPYQQADLMNAKLNQFQVPHVYKLYPNEGHSYSGAASNDALLQTQTFLNTYLK